MQKTARGNQRLYNLVIMTLLPCLLRLRPSVSENVLGVIGRAQGLASPCCVMGRRDRLTTSEKSTKIAWSGKRQRRGYLSSAVMRIRGAVIGRPLSELCLS